MTGTESALQHIDTSRPHPARVYDWLLGGEDNYPVDEELGRRMTALEPRAKHSALNNRWWHRPGPSHTGDGAGPGRG